MSAERPIIRVPEGWTYGEDSQYVMSRWERTYKVTHDVCGTEFTEHCAPVGDGGDAWWYREQCAKGLGFKIGMHKECTPTTEKGNAA